MLKALSLSLKVSLAGAIALPVTIVPPPVLAQAQTQKVTAGQLAENAEKAVALLIRTARRSKDKALSIDSDAAKPFWLALKELNTAILQLANGHALKDATFHKALGDTISKGIAVATAYELTGAKDPEVEAAYDRLEKIVGTLQDNFSKASARKRKGGDLSKQERARFAEIRKKQEQLEKRLKAMESRVKNNARAQRGIQEIRKRSVRIRNSGNSVNDFLAALIAIRIIDGILYGCHWWWGPWGGWYAGFSENYIFLYDDYLEAIPYDWDYYGGIEADIDAATLDIPVEDTELDEAQDFMEDTDIGLDGLDASDLEGVDVPAEGDLAELDDLAGDGVETMPVGGIEDELTPGDTGGAEQLPIDEDIGPGEGLPEEVPVPQPMPEPEFRPEPEPMPEPAPEPMPMPEPEPMPMPEPEPMPMPEPEPMPMPMPEPMPDMDLPMDDFGGGFDGGFDDIGGGFDFD